MTYRHVIRSIAAFVFMGCPHSSSRDPKDWSGIESILQKFTTGRKSSLEPQCIESLAVDCESFRVILAEDEKQVVTVSEKKGMSKQMFGKKVLVRLIDIIVSFLYVKLTRTVCRPGFGNYWPHQGECDRGQIQSPGPLHDVGGR